MWWALQTNGKLEKAITKNCTKMVWLGYFLRKQMQKENLLKLMAAIRKGENKAKWLQDHEIEHLYYKQRLDVKQSQEN